MRVFGIVVEERMCIADGSAVVDFEEMENVEKQNSSRSQTMDSSNDDQRIRLFNSPELFGNHSEILICHNGETYRVRITRNGKLIMNK